MDNSHHIGACSELIACAWLLKHGYEVFRNVSAAGPIDIVALKEGVLLYLDVKTERFRYSGRTITPKQAELGVKLLVVEAWNNWDCCLVLSPGVQGKRAYRELRDLRASEERLQTIRTRDAQLMQYHNTHVARQLMRDVVKLNRSFSRQFQHHEPD